MTKEKTPTVASEGNVQEKIKAQVERDPTLLNKTEDEIKNSRRWTDAEKKVVLKLKAKK